MISGNDSLSHYYRRMAVLQKACEKVREYMERHGYGELEAVLGAHAFCPEQCKGTNK